MEELDEVEDEFERMVEEVDIIWDDDCSSLLDSIERGGVKVYAFRKWKPTLFVHQ